MVGVLGKCASMEWRMEDTPAQKNESPVVCLGNRMLRAMPALEKGLPTSVFAYESIVCSALLEQPSWT